MAERTLKTTLLGQPATFLVQRETALTYVGRWLTGPLADREAHPCKLAFHGKAVGGGDAASPREEKSAAPQAPATVADALVQRYGVRTAARYARVRATKTSGALQEHWQAVQQRLDALVAGIPQG